MPGVVQGAWQQCEWPTAAEVSTSLEPAGAGAAGGLSGVYYGHVIDVAYPDCNFVHFSLNPLLQCPEEKQRRYGLQRMHNKLMMARRHDSLWGEGSRGGGQHLPAAADAGGLGRCCKET